MAPTRYDNASSGISADRVRDDDRLPVFPVFDSLPATAGLSNAEAFRLSVKYALALLPSVLDARNESIAEAAKEERFSLR